MTRASNASGSWRWPHSGTAGRLSLALAVVAVLMIVPGAMLGEAWAFVVFLGLLAMVTAFGLSIVAVTNHHDRSPLVYLPLGFGALALLFFLVEILIGHG